MSFSYKDIKHCGRRAFLRGAGTVAVGLPLLELTHGHVFATGDVPKRFITVFSHGGTLTNQGRASRFDGTNAEVGEDWFRPASPGEELVLGPIMGNLEAVAAVSDRLAGPVTQGGDNLEPFKQKLVVYTGLDNMSGIRLGEYGGGHGFCNMTCLTAHDPGDDSAGGPSLDHVLAERLLETQPARFSRLHFEVSGHQYGSPFFDGSGTRVSGEESPHTAWSTVFEGVTSEGPDPALVRQQFRGRSIVDGVREGLAQFRRAASVTDRLALDAHLEHLAALEREIQSVDVAGSCMPPGDPGSIDSAAKDRIGAVFADMIVAALRCGLTNVACLEIADIICDFTTHGNIMEAGHHIGHSLHHMGREVGATGSQASRLHDWLTEMLENRRWRVELVARILRGLDETPEGDGTMLDNSVLLYTSEFSFGAKHYGYGQPCFTAGSAGGAFRTGRHLDYNVHDTPMAYARDYGTQTSTHNLYTSILHAFGYDDDHFGNTECDFLGPLPDLV